MFAAARSPAARRKSVSLGERDLNRYDDDNLTLPITKYEQQGRKRTGRLSEVQVLRRQAQPRKSILKMSISNSEESLQQFVDESENSSPGGIVDYGATVDFGSMAHMKSSASAFQRNAPRASMPAPSMGSSRASLGPRRRVSFAPAAHVRMFEKSSEKKRRKSSMGVRMAGGLAPIPQSRRSSIQPDGSSITHIPPPASPRARFLGEGEELGEESMELEEDLDEEAEEQYDSADSDEILAQVTAMSPRQSETPQHELEDGSDSDMDAEGEMDMDETIIGGGIVEHHWDEADTDSADSDSDMELESSNEGTDDEKTMDFTVALGGPMPTVPPQNALRGRQSIGYSVPTPGGQQPLLPGEGGNDSLEMEETGVYGGVYVQDESVSSGDDTNGSRVEHTATYAMDFSFAGGGINGDGSEMDMTVANGGINYATSNYTSASGLEFTTAHGGINYQNTNVYASGSATPSIRSQNTTNIFAPTPGNWAQADRSVRAAPTPSARSVNIFSATPGSAATSAFAKSAPPVQPVSPPQHTRQRGSSATPARPGPGSTPARPGPGSTPARPGHGGNTPMRASGSTPARKRQSMGVDGTPSFARATTASTQKAKGRASLPAASQDAALLNVSTSQKRNVFAPSPGTPGLQRSKSRTPKATPGMEAAASVAKKLDFSMHSTPAKSPKLPTPKSATPRGATPKSHAATPFSARKRARSESDEETEVQKEDTPRVKRLRSSEPEPADEEDSAEDPEQADFVTAPHEADELEDMEIEREATPEEEQRPLPTYTPVDRNTPRRSLGPPRRSINISAHEQAVYVPSRRSPSPDDDTLPLEPVEPEPIPLSTFFELVGLVFGEPASAPIPRRSSVGRGILGRRREGEEDSDYALHEYLEGNLEGIFVNMWTWIIQETNKEIRRTDIDLESTERVCSENNPAVVSQYLMADEEERSIFEMTLRKIQQVTLLRARKRYYEQKQSLYEERVLPDVRSLLEDMRADSERHKVELEAVDALLPELRNRHKELEAELAQHRAEVAEIQECDQDELSGLKQGIEEQELGIQGLKDELETKTTRNSELKAKLEGLESTRGAHNNALEAARSMCDQLTISDVLRLEHELASLQELHGWRLVHAGEELRLDFLSELTLTVPFASGVPMLDKPALSLVSKPCPASPNTALLALASSALTDIHSSSLSSLVNTVTRIWSTARAVREELRLLTLYYPASYTISKTSMTASASLMLPSIRSKARLQFVLDAATLRSWPEAVRTLPVSVGSVHGSSDDKEMTHRAKETLEAADLSLPGVLLQTCFEAAALYQ